MPLVLPPTLSGDLLTIHRLLQSPDMVRRRLRTFRDLRFVSDQLLTQRLRSVGGAVIFEQSEPSTTNRTPESVAPGSEYPMADALTGTAGMAAVAKWGQRVRLTDEEITRNVYGGAEVDRKLRKVVNTIIGQVDGITMSAITSAVTQTFDVVGTGGGAWTGATPAFLRDVLRAKSVITKLNQGYKPNVLALNDSSYAFLMSDDKVTNALRREATNNPIYTGELEVLAGLIILVSPSITDPIIADNTQLGGMADEQQSSPGYAVSDMAVQVKPIRLEGNDAWDLQGRRITVPVVQETGAAIRLTNTGLTA